MNNTFLNNIHKINKNYSKDTGIEGQIGKYKILLELIQKNDKKNDNKNLKINIIKGHIQMLEMSESGADPRGKINEVVHLINEYKKTVIKPFNSSSSEGSSLSDLVIKYKEIVGKEYSDTNKSLFNSIESYTSNSNTSNSNTKLSDYDKLNEIKKVVENMLIFLPRNSVNGRNRISILDKILKDIENRLKELSIKQLLNAYKPLSKSSSTNQNFLKEMKKIIETKLPLYNKYTRLKERIQTQYKLLSVTEKKSNKTKILAKIIQKIEEDMQKYEISENKSFIINNPPRYNLSSLSMNQEKESSNSSSSLLYKIYNPNTGIIPNRGILKSGIIEINNSSTIKKGRYTIHYISTDGTCGYHAIAYGLLLKGYDMLKFVNPVFLNEQEKEELIEKYIHINDKDRQVYLVKNGFLLRDIVVKILDNYKKGRYINSHVNTYISGLLEIKSLGGSNQNSINSIISSIRISNYSKSSLNEKYIHEGILYLISNILGIIIKVYFYKLNKPNYKSLTEININKHTEILEYKPISEYLRSNRETPTISMITYSDYPHYDLITDESNII